MKELVKKINAVMQELGAVEKKGFNQAQKYKYMAHADLMSALHPLLIKNGLVIYPESSRIQSCTSETWDAVWNDKKETKRQNRVTVETTYAITDGESKITFCGVGEGVDTQDKSSYKAQTGAHKYALKQLFQIPDELDAEDDSEATDPKKNGKKEDAESTLKAGKTRSNTLKNYLDANILTEDEAAQLLGKNNAESFEQLPATAADKAIEVCKKREAKLNGGK